MNMHLSTPHFLCRTPLAAAYLVAVAMLVVTTCGCGKSVQASGSAQPAGPVDPRQAARLHSFQSEVQPVLQTNCYRCHAGMNRRGGLDMSTRARLLQGGKDGVVVIPGRPEDSLLVRVIGPTLAEGDPMRMPPKGARLTEAQVAAIRTWVADGLVMDK